jgi:hypothetical protein
MLEEICICKNGHEASGTGFEPNTRSVQSVTAAASCLIQLYRTILLWLVLAGTNFGQSGFTLRAGLAKMTVGIDNLDGSTHSTGSQFPPNDRTIKK